VDEHERDVLGHELEAAPDGLRPCGAARHCGRDLPGSEVVDDGREAVLPSLRHDADHAVDARMLLERLQGGRHEGPVAQPHERLRAVGVQSLADPAATTTHQTSSAPSDTTRRQELDSVPASRCTAISSSRSSR
jgi:hypothetical protein